MNYVYLQAKFSEMKNDYSKITVTIETRDQGWASVENSNSYFDLRIVNENGNLLGEISRIIENYKQEEFVRRTYVLKRNGCQHETHMCGNNVLQLVMRSQYPGWENYARFGEIKFE